MTTLHSNQAYKAHNIYLIIKYLKGQRRPKVNCKTLVILKLTYESSKAYEGQRYGEGYQTQQGQLPSFN